jgi:hypothetical protein
MHARHYSPSLGRFLQPDPSRLDAQLFVYAGNGPVSRVDPSGLDDWWQSYRYLQERALRKSTLASGPESLQLGGERIVCSRPPKL